MSQATRIRYKKVSDTSMVSPEYLGGEHVYRGVIALDTRTCSVERKDDGVYTPVHVHACKDLIEAKKVIKSYLKSVGVTFYEEARNRKPKEVV